jgi:hypothetical protein
MKRRVQRLVNRLLEPVVGPVREELRQVNFHLRRAAITNPLLACGRRHFSQNDEDGILLEILRRIEIAQPAAFVEFGVGDGTENNTIILLALGWRGVWIGGQSLSFQVPSDSNRLLFLQRWITKDNAAKLTQEALATMGVSLQDVRVASVDLDGNDGHVVRAVLAGGLAPGILILEYNPKFPPSVEFEMPYDPDHHWRADHYFGVSLLKWTNILLPSGYALIACNESGVNAFFVKTKHISRFADVSTKIEELYRCGFNQNPTSPRTVRHLVMARD